MLRCCHEADWDLLGIHLVAEGGSSVVFEQPNTRCCVLKAVKVSSEPSASAEERFFEKDIEFIDNNIRLWGNLDSFVVRTTPFFQLTDHQRNSIEEIWRDQQSANRREENNNDNRALSVYIRLEDNVFFSSPIILEGGILSYTKLSFEIKVKGALTSISPFLYEESSCIKHHKSRFEIMQLYKEFKRSVDAQSAAPWGTFRNLSIYSPADFCSRDYNRTYNAVESLFSNPQNNLKMFLDGQHVYGWSKDTAEDLHTCMLLLSQTSAIDLTKLKAVVANNICNQYGAQIDDILSMQAVDVLDSEGAELTYRHLLSFFDNEISCKRELADYIISPISSNYKDFSETLLEMRSGVASPTISNFSPGIQRVLQSVIIEPDLNASEKQRRHMDVTKILIEICTKEDCLFLLKSWMLSTIACDASIVLSVDLDNNGNVFGSNLHLIDCGLKSLSKLTTKATKDITICRLVAKKLDIEAASTINHL